MNEQIPKGVPVNMTFIVLAMRALGAFSPPAQLTKTIQLRVSPEWLASVDGFVQEAKERGLQLTRSDVIRMATEQWVKSDDTDRDWPADEDLRLFFEEHRDLLTELLGNLNTDVRS